MVGFDALGRLALGQIQRGNVSMPAVSGSFAVSGVAQAFKVTESTSAGSFAISGAPITQIIGVATGAFVLTGKAQSFSLVENVTAGSYVITGSIANNISGTAEPGSYRLTGVDQTLIRTGDDYEFKLGGVGHFLEEIERQKQLNAITRKIPGPVDRRTTPRFAPLQAAPAAPPAPAVDMAAIAAQRQAEAARAAAIRRRRDEEALLLLAS